MPIVQFLGIVVVEKNCMLLKAVFNILVLDYMWVEILGNSLCGSVQLYTTANYNNKQTVTLN